MSDLGHDLRLAVRRLVAAPALTLFSILTLTLGIGATTVSYSLVHAILAPLSGVADVRSLVNITHTESGSIPMMGFAYGDFQDLQARQTVFDGVAGWSLMRPSIVANGHAESGVAEMVTGNYFQVLGVVPGHGRALQPADDVAGATPVVVIGHGVWQRVFGGAPDVAGRTLKINGTDFEVVGVAPPTFRGVFNNGHLTTALWIPLSAASKAAGAGTSISLDDDRDSRWLMVKARLKPGVDLARARAEVIGIGRQLDVSHPIGRNLDARFQWPYAVSRQWIVKRTADVTINEGTADMATPVAATFMAIVGLVLLVACTNLANLALARGSVRRDEMAVRLALGASRWRLIRGLVVEDLIVTVTGGVLGVLLTRWLFVVVVDDFPISEGASLHLGVRIDMAVLAASAIATFLALVVAGVLPALHVTRGDLRARLSSGALQSMPRWRGRRLLIAGQVMVSVLLVSVAALCVTQVRAANRIDTGMDLDHLAIVGSDFASQRYAPERATQIVDAVLTQMRGRPGVIAAAATSGLTGLNPLGASVGTGGALNSFGDLVSGTPDLFKALGVQTTRGRAFDERDTRGEEEVAIISETTSRRLFGRADAVGESLAFRRQRWAGEDEPPEKTVRVVGIATDTRTRYAAGRERLVVYVPIAQQYEGRLTLLVRSQGDPEPFVAALRQALAAVDRETAVTQAGTGPRLFAGANPTLAIIGSISGGLGAFALSLALVGLYGVLSHVIARRTREIGLRIALGADRRAILRMVLREGLRPVFFGLAGGLAVGVLARLALRPLFVNLLPAFDAVVMSLVPLLMVLAALAAISLPARRAAAVDPNTALRNL
jgi:predicted permease